MKAILLIIALLAVFASFAAACQDGEEWMEACNRCWCVNGNKACTRKACPGERSSFTKRRACQDGEEWMEACNRCWCVNGNKACTRKACPEERSSFSRRREPCISDEVRTEGGCIKACSGLKCDQMPSKTRTKRAGKCKPGDRWYEDCNSCFCTNLGVPACTRKGCL